VSNTVKIHDRVKETSTSVGQGNFGLLGAVAGFTSFENSFDHLDTVFYAIADRTNYEVGSGVFYKSGGALPGGGTVTYSYITRSPLSSSNSNSLVDFNSGTKEVFATYPATHAVYNGAGLGNFNTPTQYAVSFWDSANMINSDSNFIWNPDYKSLGLQNNTPVYGIDIGGDGSQQSSIRASGYYVGISGVTFRPTNGDDAQYVGGIQYKHFLPNETNVETKSSLVIEYSGVVNQYALLKKQTVNHVFAAPTGVCDGPCPEGYPSFRQLYATDIPDLSDSYATLTQLAVTSGDLIGVMDTKIAATGDALDTKYVALSGYLLDWNRDNNENIYSHFVAESGRADQFFINHSGRLDEQFNGFVEDNAPVYLSAVGSGNSPDFGVSRSYNNFATFNFDSIESDSHPTSFSTSTYMYSAPKSGVYTINANMVGSGDTAFTTDGIPQFRLVTSGNEVLTTGNLQYINVASGVVGSAGKVWNVSLASGDKAYLEAEGKFGNSSTISIHRI